MKKNIFAAALAVTLTAIGTTATARAEVDPYTLGYWDDYGNWIGEGWWNEEGYHYSDSSNNYNYSYSDNSWEASVSASTIGDMGTLVFADGSEFPLYYADNWDYDYGQSIINAWNSALWTDYSGTTLICDHAGQGFRVMKSYGVGSVAYIVHDGWTDTIQCVGYYGNCSCYGEPILPDGRSCLEGDSNLIMQTCNNSSGTNVTISYWQYI